ncbi:MAG TPA: DUF763 domain-containing protein [Patescibacteria group bacterium]|nr:DUF763 domain-containing protein [Patescibacteria group bacterium]
MRRGIATFTLDYGKCPPWLFERMVRLGREMTYVLVSEYGPDEFIKRIADPVWFQSLGTVLAFDWNASGLTTILTAALKEAIRGAEMDLGIFIAGGKGKTSRKTPDEIANWGERLNFNPNLSKELVYSSKMSAKVDSSLVQDGYQIYHHAFFFSKNGAWTVVQQGMNTDNQTARRYHWSDKVDLQSKKDFVNEPHQAIASQKFLQSVLNLTSKDSAKTRDTSTDLIKSGTKQLLKDLELLREHQNSVSRMVTFKDKSEQYTFLKLEGVEFKHHPVELEDFNKSKYLDRILQKVAELGPQTYEQFLSVSGVGPKTVRALSLVSEVIYGATPSYTDPARYSFAHGGKDATPYPVDKTTYDKTIEVLKDAVSKTKLNYDEKSKAILRLK